MIEISLELALVLIALAIVAGFMDTLAGGGGLITIPGLMLTGLPPIAVIATNKLQGCSGTATATLLLFRRRHLYWPDLKWPMLWAAIGASIGALLVRQVNTNYLELLVPGVLIFIALYFLLLPLIKTKRQIRISSRHYQTRVIPLIGMYDGALGPGTGSFFSMAANALQKQPIIEAVKQAKALNFATNAASLTVFALLGEVVWSVGAIMIIGQVLGASLGARTLIKINPKILRPIIVLVCIIMLASYFYHQ